MLTKGAIGNLVNRYKAVLKKCNLINTFGSLAVASMLVLGGAGVASAGDWSGKNVTSVVPANQQFDPGDKIYGGWKTSSPEEKHRNLNTDLTINGGELASKDHMNIANGMVIGGNYISSNANAGIFTTNSTKVVINNVQTETVVGGNHNYNSSLTFNIKDTKNPKGTTNVTINNGFFGKTTPDTDVPELYVLGGDWIKNHQSCSVDASSTLKDTYLTINGGTFYSAIIGGSGILEVYQACKNDTDVFVQTTNITINGGEFNHPIIGGGLTWGGWGDGSTAIIKSEVKTAKINISGKSGTPLTIKHDIYSGGVQDRATERNINSVGNAIINIDNTTINNLYGTNALISAGERKHNSITGYDYVETWNYSHDATHPVNTNLKLTNTTVTGEVYIPKGSVELRAENKGKVKIKDFKPGAGVPVTMSTDGVTNDFFGGDAQKLVDDSFVFDDKTQKDGKLRAEAGIVIGELTGDVVDGVVSNVTEKPSETNVAMADLPNINHMLTRVEMNDLRKRMGDIRLLEGETGTWARWEGGRLKGDNGLTNDFHKIQLGADTTTGIESLRLGASFSYTNGDMDFAKASAESDTLSFAGYGVWTADNGMFADVIARLAFIDTEIQTDKVKGELDNLAFSLSGEYGWRFNLCDQFFVEPQVELTYTYIDSDDFTSAGAKFDFDSSDSLIGRAGLAAGWKLPDDRGDLYARASVVQEFMGDGKLTASMGNTLRRYETDGDDTWFEYGIGANIKLNKNVYVFGDVERTEGAEIDEEWRGTVGLRYSF